MSKSKSSISKAQSYEDIGEFWDTHDLADYWDRTHPVEFEIDIQFEATWKEGLTVNKRPPLKYCKHLMAGGRHCHPPLIAKTIKEPGKR